MLAEDPRVDIGAELAPDGSRILYLRIRDVSIDFYVFYWILYVDLIKGIMFFFILTSVCFVQFSLSTLTD